jgi:hypothetical protein
MFTVPTSKRGGKSGAVIYDSRAIARQKYRLRDRRGVVVLPHAVMHVAVLNSRCEIVKARWKIANSSD